jgi:hypothetical protein
MFLAERASWRPSFGRPLRHVKKGGIELGFGNWGWWATPVLIGSGRHFPTEVEIIYKYVKVL